MLCHAPPPRSNRSSTLERCARSSSPAPGATRSSRSRSGRIRSPSGDDVLLAVRYAALNGADLAQRAGRYPAPPGSPPDIPGIETAGTVIGHGPTARRFQAGDRVFGIVGGGGLADRVLVHERHVAPVPANLDELAAAAVPEVFITAHDAIVTLGALQLGELLVVTGANGGVGTAAVQIGAVAGARVIATAARRASAARSPCSARRRSTPDDLVEPRAGARRRGRRARARRCAKPRAGFRRAGESRDASSSSARVRATRHRCRCAS